MKVFNATSSSDIRGLVLRNTGGYVFEDRVNTKPSVVFRASSSNVLIALTINVIPGNILNVLELAFAQNVTVDGQYLINIYIPTNLIQYLQTDQGGDTVVAPRIFTANASTPISISSFGAGSIVIESSRLVASRLLVESRGSGRIQVNVRRSISADSIDLSTSGFGSIALVAPSTTAKQLSAVSSGSGSVFVGTSAPTNATAPVSLHATTLVAKAFGDGNVFFMDAGTCHGNDVQTSGHGNVYLHHVRCENTNALVLGSGNMYLTTTGMLRVQDMGAGSAYVAEEPSVKVVGPVLPMPQEVPVPPYARLVVSDRSPRAIHLIANSTTTTPAISSSNQGVHLAIWFACILVPWVVAFFVIVVRKIRAKRAIQVQLKAFTEATTPMSVNQVVLHL
ncbi:hypothetical protein DYB30_005164 [Aphanomyces astaci]|uniref:Uncharacterized protein n=1 Tax=Aphanomyces astaci TaxID=112090 RepID=A0A397C5X1_APHAT|nr:hypothetical protein DYB36_004283 [Aphanomyces astaci]RHY38838.1 hypothetical protein DYB30_005164 [Aphanomyces astaci]